jgi:hypothetical protein
MHQQANVRIFHAQLVRKILDLCDLEQLCMLRTTGRFFSTCGPIEEEARKRCQEINRAQGLQPLKRCAYIPLPSTRYLLKSMLSRRLPFYLCARSAGRKRPG